MKMALVHGLNEIFFASATLMTLAIGLHIALKDVKLRGRIVTVDAPPAH